jgi:hypothetical protein
MGEKETNFMLQLKGKLLKEIFNRFCDPERVKCL